MTVIESGQRLLPPDALARELSAGRPFGSSDYIHRQAQAVFRRRLLTVGETLPPAAELVDSLDTQSELVGEVVLGDPLLRAAVQHALAQLSTGDTSSLRLADCASVFSEATRRFDSPDAGDLMESAGLSAGKLSECQAGWIWSGLREDNHFAELFTALVGRYFPDPTGAPAPGDIEALRQAAALLDNVCPSLSRSALSHVRTVVLTPDSGRWRNVASCSLFELPGVVFLARSTLRNPWCSAEHLLHEALHQKLYDLRHTHTVLLRDFHPNGHGEPSGPQPRVVSLWNTEDTPGSNRWGPSRCLAAFHVYAHLAIYAGLAVPLYDADKPPGLPSYEQAGMVGPVTAFRRGRYLGTELLDKYADQLGDAGLCLVDWLRQSQTMTLPVPSEHQLRALLTLERYSREISRIEETAASQRPSTLESYSDLLRELITSEVAMARAVLGACRQSSELERFDAQVWAGDRDSRRPVGLADVARARKVIAQTLGPVLEIDGGEETAACDNLVSTMDNSTGMLVTLL